MSYLDQMFGLPGKVAIVVGGGGVLAGAMAEALAQAGADVVIADLNYENAAQKTDQLKREFQARALAVEMNAGEKTEIEKALEVVMNEFGRIDIVINAPGINSSTPFFEIGEEEWEKYSP